MQLPEKLSKRNAELQRLADAEERWHRKLMRSANALDDIRRQRKRLLKPRPLTEIESGLKITGKEYTKIRHVIGDTLDDKINF
jgi:hypothetical protein